MAILKSTQTLAMILALGAASGCSTNEERVAAERKAFVTDSATAGTMYLGSPKQLALSNEYDYGKVAVAAGDMNGDGITDLVTAGVNADILFYEGFGNGKYAAPIKVGTIIEYDDSGVALTLTDVDGDGRPDVVVYGSGTGLRYFPNTFPQKNKIDDIRKKQ